MEYTVSKFAIKAWAEEDRPREKLIHHGPNALSKSELIAILLGTGSRSVSAVALAKNILEAHGQKISQIGKLSVKELSNFKGIGPAKAVSILAAIELGRRKNLEKMGDNPKITSSVDAYQLLFPDLIDLNYEVFKIMMLNRQNKIIRISTISLGGVAGTVVDPKIIFKTALEHLSSALILCHNHPSGNLNPSQADIDITKKLKSCGDLLDIKILDHLIISQEGYYSFADEGLI